MIAIETGAIGHNICVVTACSTGTNCVGEGAELIRRGDVHTVITGSAEMPLLEVAHAGFGNMRGLGSPREGLPAHRRLAAVRPHPGRLRPRRGRRLADPRGPRVREGPRRADLRGGRGLRVGRGRLGHGPADRRRHGLGARDAGVAGPARRPGGRGRRDQPARHVHAARRQARGRGHLDGLRGPGRRRPPVARDHRDEVDDRAHDGRRRRLRGVRDRDDRRRAVRPRDAQLPASPTPRRTCGSFPETTAMPVRYALSNNIGLGGHNGAIIFKRWDGA